MGRNQGSDMVLVRMIDQWLKCVVWNNDNWGVVRNQIPLATEVLYLVKFYFILFLGGCMKGLPIAISFFLHYLKRNCFLMLHYLIVCPNCSDHDHGIKYWIELWWSDKNTIWNHHPETVNKDQRAGSSVLCWPNTIVTLPSINTFTLSHLVFIIHLDMFTLLRYYNSKNFQLCWPTLVAMIMDETQVLLPCIICYTFTDSFMHFRFENFESITPVELNHML